MVTSGVTGPMSLRLAGAAEAGTGTAGGEHGDTVLPGLAEEFQKGSPQT